MIKVSFCVTCMNRFHQINKTLPQNLKDNIDHQNMIEFILVDFGSNKHFFLRVKEYTTEELGQLAVLEVS